MPARFGSARSSSGSITRGRTTIWRGARLRDDTWFGAIPTLTAAGARDRTHPSRSTGRVAELPSSGAVREGARSRSTTSRAAGSRSASVRAAWVGTRRCSASRPGRRANAPIASPSSSSSPTCSSASRHRRTPGATTPPTTRGPTRDASSSRASRSRSRRPGPARCGSRRRSRIRGSRPAIASPKRSSRATKAPEVVRTQIAMLEAACAEVGRDPARSSGSCSPASASTRAWRRPDAFADTIGRYDAVGVTDFVVHWPRASRPLRRRRPGIRGHLLALQGITVANASSVYCFAVTYDRSP